MSTSESKGNVGFLTGATKAGIAAGLPTSSGFEALVAPSIHGEFNTARLRLIPIACWRVEDVRFEFGSSFVLPGLKDEMRLLAALITEHSKISEAGTQPPSLTIFGHADPVNNDEFNKLLSGRRAAAIYGLLTRRDEVWEDLFSNGGRFAQPVAGDNWGDKSLQAMRNTLGPDAPQSRKQLFRAYMDKVCVDAQGKPFQVDLVHGFLARNADGTGKGDFQGCGEFNPVVIFSEEENRKFEQAKNKTERNDANAPNRRVTILLFRPGSQILPAKWPCPRVKEGTAGCVKRFFSDGETRRSSRLPDETRKFENTEDTFACRFYHRLSGPSPCERGFKTFRVRLYDAFARSIPLAPFTVSIGGRAFSPLATADAEGFILLSDVEVPANCVIRWGFPPSDSEEPQLLFDRKIFLVSKEDPNPELAKQKLNNLGYHEDDDASNILGFQLDFGHLADPALDTTGVLDDRTLSLLNEVYQQSKDNLRDSTHDSA